MTALIIPAREFSPGRAAAAAAVSAGTAVAYLVACSRASQVLGLRGSAGAAPELGLAAVSLILGAVAGLAAYLYLGQPHVQTFLWRAGALTLNALTTLAPALMLTYVLDAPLSRVWPHPAGTIAAFILPAVLVHAARRVFASRGAR